MGETIILLPSIKTQVYVYRDLRLNYIDTSTAACDIYNNSVMEVLRWRI